MEYYAAVKRKVFTGMEQFLRCIINEKIKEQNVAYCKLFFFKRKGYTYIVKISKCKYE